MNPYLLSTAILLAALSLAAYYILILHECLADARDDLAEAQAESATQRQRANALRMRNQALTTAWQVVCEDKAALQQRRYVITSRWWRRQQYRSLAGWKIQRGRG